MGDESTVARAIRLASEATGGGQAGLAAKLGITGSSPRAVVWAWINRGRVPHEYCHAVVRLGGPKVKLWDVRPEDWHKVWPELIGADGAPAVPAEAERAGA